MRLELFYVGVLLIVVSFILYALQTPEVTKNQANQTQTSASEPSKKTLPSCVIDLECGQDNYTDYFCYGAYIVRDKITHKCVNPGFEDAYCNTTSERDVFDQCRADEVCVEGEKICQPKLSCYDGVKNQGETGVDCGGICRPCSSCADGVKTGDEEGVDCGGSCPPCGIYCSSNESCGIPRWSKPYCGADADGIPIVLQDFIDYECKNPAKASSRCVYVNQTTRVSDYCGPLALCYGGRCYDQDEELPTPIDDGINQGTTDMDDGQVYTTCRGSWCYELKRYPQDAN